MKNVTRLLGSAVAVLGGITVSAAPIASADATDATFVAALAQKGITFPNLSDEQVGTLGRGVCKDWDGGASISATVADVHNTTQLSDNGSSFFVGAATQSYCPKYASKFDN
jgi:hypothetical protein